MQGNRIGTTAAGTAALTQNNGIYINAGAHDITIGGTASGAGNLISGNLLDGIRLLGGRTTGVTVEGNLIGTDAAGAADLGNEGAGVSLTDGARWVITQVCLALTGLSAMLLDF